MESLPKKCVRFSAWSSCTASFPFVANLTYMYAEIFYPDLLISCARSDASEEGGPHVLGCPGQSDRQRKVRANTSTLTIVSLEHHGPQCKTLRTVDRKVVVFGTCVLLNCVIASRFGGLFFSLGCEFLLVFRSHAHSTCGVKSLLRVTVWQ